jgi:Protein of unknown function (DUF2384)
MPELEQNPAHLPFIASKLIMPEVKDLSGAALEDEPRLARQLVGVFSSLGADEAAALFTHAAWLALKQPHGRTPAAPARKASSKQAARSFRPETPVSQDIAVTNQAIDPRIDALQALVDRSAFKPFDQRMEASMAQSIDAIFKGTQWLTAAELGRAARPDAANPHSIPSRWRAAKKIFGVERRGQLLFARYQFDAAFEPLAAVAGILSVLAASSPIGIASWFESPNAFLDGARPRELLSTEPGLVIQAAEDSLVGPSHG